MATLAKVFLIDGNSLLYRAHFAFIRAPLTNSKGFETSAIFGFARMLFDILDKHKPDYLLVAFDKAKKTFGTVGNGPSQVDFLSVTNKSDTTRRSWVTCVCRSRWATPGSRTLRRHSSR